MGFKAPASVTKAPSSVTKAASDAPPKPAWEGKIPDAPPPSYAAHVAAHPPPQFQSGLPGSFGSAPRPGAAPHTAFMDASQNFSGRFLDYVKHNPKKTAAVGAAGVMALGMYGADSTPSTAPSGTTGGTSRYDSSEPTYSESGLPPSGQVVY